MKLYFAPMEGITGCVYRNIHHKHFPGIDKYFSPFLSPGPEKGVGRKELRDVLPENNRGIPLVPQILTNRAEDFIKAAKLLGGMGYREVNLNLGCPSGTVVAKKKGAGFLACPDELDAFLERIFSWADAGGAPGISVKTRIGVNSAGEFLRLLEIFNRYPILELTVHPRLRADYYGNTPDWDVFAGALRGSKNPVAYNGDIFTVDDYCRFASRFPEVDAVMIGRGILADPMLAGRVRGAAGRNLGKAEPAGRPGERLPEKAGSRPGERLPDKADRLPDGELRRVRAFHDELCGAYEEAFSGERNVLFKMKEVWGYLIHLFPDGEKAGKKIRKAQSLGAYRAAVEELFGAQA